MRRWGRHVVGLAVGASVTLASCTSYRLLVESFDSISGFDPVTQSEPEKLEYSDHALLAPALLQSLEALVPFIGVQTELEAIENPSEFVRENVLAMVDAAGTKLTRLTGAAWRMLLVIDKDPSPLNRASTLFELAKLGKAFRSESPERDEAGFSRNPAAAASYERAARNLVAQLDAAWPKPEADRSDKARFGYVKAISELADLDAATLEFERSRLRLLLEAVGWESDREVQRRVAGALLRALRSAINRGLVEGLWDKESRVRGAAAVAIYRYGGAELLPLVFAELRRRTTSILPKALAAQTPFELEPTLRRRLLRIAWGAGLDACKVQHGEGPSPLRALVDASLDDPEASLRSVAREALAHQTRRPVDPEGAWIREWWQGFVSSGASGQ